MVAPKITDYPVTGYAVTCGYAAGLSHLCAHLLQPPPAQSPTFHRRLSSTVLQLCIILLRTIYIYIQYLVSSFIFSANFCGPGIQSLHELRPSHKIFMRHMASSRHRRPSMSDYDRPSPAVSALADVCYGCHHTNHSNLDRWAMQPSLTSHGSASSSPAPVLHDVSGRPQPCQLLHFCHLPDHLLYMTTCALSSVMPSPTSMRLFTAPLPQTAPHHNPPPQCLDMAVLDPYSLATIATPIGTPSNVSGEEEVGQARWLERVGVLSPHLPLLWVV
jgi:hypothetical protein